MRSQSEEILKYTGQLSHLPGSIGDSNDDNDSNTASVFEIPDDKVEEIVYDDDNCPTAIHHQQSLRLGGHHVVSLIPRQFECRVVLDWVDTLQGRVNH